MFEYDVICKTCRAVIDHHLCPTEEAAKNGYVAALLAVDAVAHHRHTGCPCEGWSTSPVAETP